MQEELMNKVVDEIKKRMETQAAPEDAAKGKPAVYQNLWGKDIVMGYVSPTISPKTVSLGWDFTLSHGVLSDGEEQTYRVRTWRDESIGGGGDWIEVDYEAEAAIVCPDVGFLIKNAVA